MFPLVVLNRSLPQSLLVRVRGARRTGGDLYRQLHRRKSGTFESAILHSTDQFGVGGAETITQALANKGLKPVAVEAFNTGDRDLPASSISASAGPRPLVGWAFDVELALMCRQAVSSSPVSSSLVRAPRSGELLANRRGSCRRLVGVVTYSSTVQDPAVEKLINDYKARYGSVPQNFFVSSL